MSAVIERDSVAYYICMVFCRSSSCYQAKWGNYEPIEKMRR